MACVGFSLNSHNPAQFFRRSASISAKSFALVLSANLCAPWVGFSFKRWPGCQARYCLVPALVVMFSLLSMHNPWLRTFLVKRIPLFYKVLCCRLFLVNCIR